MNLDFYKEKDGRWYVDLPHWQGDKAELEMVCNADVMLDILADGEDEITLEVELTDDPLYHRALVAVLTKNVEDQVDSGAIYNADLPCHYKVRHLTIWLCPVTEFVLGSYPQHIYIY